MGLVEGLRSERAAKRLHIHTPDSCIFCVACFIPSRPTCSARSISSPGVFAQLTCGREATGTQDRRLGSCSSTKSFESLIRPNSYQSPSPQDDKLSNLPSYHPSSIPITEWTTNSRKYCPQLPCAASILLYLPLLSRPSPRSPSDPTPSGRSERSLLRNLKIHHPLPYFLTCAISLHLEPWHLQPCTDIPAPKLQSLLLHAQAGPRVSAVISLQSPVLLPFRYQPTCDLRLPTLPPLSPRR